MSENAYTQRLCTGETYSYVVGDTADPMFRVILDGEVDLAARLHRHTRPVSTDDLGGQGIHPYPPEHRVDER